MHAGPGPLDVALAAVKQNRLDGTAFNALGQFFRRAGQVGKGREQIVANDRHGRVRARLDAGAGGEERHAQAALVVGALAGAKRLVEMRILPREAAVVRGEKHVGVVGQLELVEHVENAADRLVEVVDHRRIPVGGVHLARRAGLVSGQRGRLGLGREVDGVVRYLQIKRHAGMGLVPDELHGVVGEGDGALGVVVREMLGLVGGQLPGGVVAGAAVGGVVAQFRGMAVHVPFAEVRRPVRGVDRLEHLRDGASRERLWVVDGAVGGFLELGRCHAELDGMARRRANRVGRIRLREDHPRVSKPLEIGREVVVGSGVGTRRDHRHLGVVPALVVREDEDNVGPLGQGGGGRQAKQQGGSEQVARCVFHGWRKV